MVRIERLVYAGYSANPITAELNREAGRPIRRETVSRWLSARGKRLAEAMGLQAGIVRAELLKHALRDQVRLDALIAKLEASEKPHLVASSRLARGNPHLGALPRPCR